jgi:hypothetical protein
MIFKVEQRQGLWHVDEAQHRIGGWFVDLQSALRFIRQYETSARILVMGSPVAELLEVRHQDDVKIARIKAA